MHPSLCDNPKRSARWRIVTEIDLNIMISCDALIFAPAKCVEIVSVKSVDDVRNILAIVIYCFGDFARC